MSASEGWKQLVEKKQKEIAQDFPGEWRLHPDVLEKYRAPGVDLISSDVLQRLSFLSEQELEITGNHSASDLVKQMRNGILTSTTVTTAFAKRAAVAQQLTSCLTETMFPEALERAKYLDDYLRQHGKVLGPLHGLPVSIKDSFNVKGKQTTVGYVEFIKHAPKEQNGPLVDLLLDLGAVIYVKTNIPHTMMTADSENNIFGRTLNPHNTNLTAGGSSGGEGALVAFRGSPLGVGTDVAGSIRIPALCCGTYGFRPTADRIPWGGPAAADFQGLPKIRVSCGPLANTFEDLELFTSTVLSAETWKYDVDSTGVPWNATSAVLSSPKLTIGVLEEHPRYPLHPPVRRALDSAASALQKHGHTIIPIDHSSGRDIAFGNRLGFQFFTYAPRVDNIAASGEPAIASVLKRASPMFTGEPPVPNDLPPFEKINQLEIERSKYRDAWRRTWVEKKLDVILMPGAQNTAVPLDMYGWPPYTFLANLLDYPACIIPYGKASKELDPQPFSPDDDVQPKYDPEATHGAPCVIQVMAPRFQDEKCLAMARIIDHDIR